MRACRAGHSREVATSAPLARQGQPPARVSGRRVLASEGGQDRALRVGWLVAACAN